jgi:uncharacterized membrane protein YfcA
MLGQAAAELALVVLATAAGALAQAVTGIGLMLVCGPLLLTLLGRTEGVRLAVVISLVLNAMLLTRCWRAVRIRDAFSLFVPAALIIPPLAMVLRSVDTRIATAVAGAVVILAAALLSTGRTWRWLATRPGTVLAGMTSGAMNALSATGGPLVALYARNAQWSYAATVGTLQAYFAAVNLVALATLGPPNRFILLPPAAAGLTLGLLAGRPLARRISPHPPGVSC